MEVKASLKYLRISPRKVRLVANLIKNLPVKEAENQLNFLNKRSTEPVLKLLKSAVQNAKHNFNLSEDRLYVAEIRVDEGPALKRWMPRAQGAASPIRKRSSHVSIVLKEIGDDKQTLKAKKQKSKIKSQKTKDKI